MNNKRDFYVEAQYYPEGYAVHAKIYCAFKVSETDLQVAPREMLKINVFHKPGFTIVEIMAENWDVFNDTVNEFYKKYIKEGKQNDTL